VPVDRSRLRSVPLFTGFAEDELEELGGTADLQSAEAGEVLMREGASGYSFFVILDGTVDVERDGTFLEQLGPGDFFGEMAIISAGRRNATITAASPVELLVLFGTAFRTLEQDHAEAAERIRQKVAERIERAGG
jgi:CRP-like cAMP-binding protein